MFRAKKLDLGCFTNVRVLRDHSKRKAFLEAEPERYLPTPCDPQLFATMARTYDLTTSYFLIQTSPALRYPQHHPPCPYQGRRPAPAHPDACLHQADADPEPLHPWWKESRYLEGLQDDKSTSLSIALKEEWCAKS